MPRSARRSLLASSLLAALLTGCQLAADEVPGSAAPKAAPTPRNVLTGLVLAPASLISNNAASIISNHSGSYRVTAVRELPVAQAQVSLECADGSTAARASTDQTGRYSFPDIELDRAYLLRISFTVDGKTYREMALAKPTSSMTEAPVTSASTLVSAKIVSMIGQAAIDQVAIPKVQQLVDKVSNAQAEESPPALDSLESSAQALDRMAGTDPTLTQDLGDAMGEPLGGTVK